MGTTFETYSAWFKSRTPGECALQAMAIEHEKYFADMQLQSPSMRRLFQYEAEFDGEWKPVEDDPPTISLDYWTFRSRQFRGEKEGECDHRKKCISIKSGLVGAKLKATVLHEMIHAIERQIPEGFKECVLLELHSRMSNKIGKRKLRRYIETSLHRLVHEQAHGVLFLLKSLELDLRFRWEPGTVFAYGRPEMFSGN